MMISRGNFWYVGKLVAYERLSQPEIGLYMEIGLLKKRCHKKRYV